VGKRWCDVTVKTVDGKRHTITVESASVYEAAMELFGRSGATCSGESLPPTKQGHGLRSASDLPSDPETTRGLGQREDGALSAIAEVSQVALIGWMQQPLGDSPSPDSQLCKRRRLQDCWKLLP